MKEGWKPRIEPKDKPPSLDRRMFLQALGGLVATAALAKETAKLSGTLLERAMYTEESSTLRERILDGMVKTVGSNLHSPRIIAALHGKEHKDLVQVIKALEVPILPQHLQETSYDVSSISEKYETQIALFRNKNNELTIADRAAVLSDANNSNGNDFLSAVDAAYANGVYIEPHIILTNAHVVGMMLEKSGYADKKDIDIGLLRVNERLAARPQTGIISYMNAMTDKTIHGSFVAIAGIDPDETSERHGHKIYPGVAIRVTKELAKLILAADESGPITNEDLRRKIENSFMLILPPGESKLDASTDQRPAMGMSGSPVYAKTPKGFEFGGMFWGAWQIRADNKSVDVGFFHGVDEIRAATKEIKIEYIPEQ